MFCVFCNLCSPLAGAERSSRVCQGTLNPLSGRVRASHHAPRDPLRVLERCHGFAEIVERGGPGVLELRAAGLVSIFGLDGCADGRRCRRRRGGVDR